MQDKFPRWPSAYAVPEISAETTVDCIEKFAGDYGFYKVRRIIFAENVELGLKEPRRNRIVHVDQLKMCTSTSRRIFRTESEQSWIR